MFVKSHGSSNKMMTNAKPWVMHLVPGSAFELGSDAVVMVHSHGASSAAH